MDGEYIDLSVDGNNMKTRVWIPGKLMEIIRNMGDERYDLDSVFADIFLDGIKIGEREAFAKFVGSLE